MFGIGGSEIFLIIAVFLMLFGADKVPELARTLGKGMAQIKNATNDIKSEIQKTATDTGFDKDSLTGGLTKEIDDVKASFTKIVDQNIGDVSLTDHTIVKDVQKDIDTFNQSLEDFSGPIKRQR